LFRQLRITPPRKLKEASVMKTIDTFPQSLANKDQDRLRQYRENLDFYNGLQWAGTTRSRERRLTFNYAKVFIDKLTSYLMSGITPAIDPSNDSPEQKERARKAEDLLQQVYQQNNLDLLDFDTEIDCSILGDACYKVIWDSQAKMVKVTAPDVQGIFCWWRGDDVSTFYRLASRYTLSKDEVHHIYKTTTAAEKATIVEDWTADSLTLYIDNQPYKTFRNPYGFIPFVIYPNLREPKKFWGVSDLPQIMEPQRELNRAMTQLSRILELSGNPIAVLENIEESEDIAVQPGAVWNIPEGAKAYLIDLLKGGGVRMHINYIDLLYRTIHDISESPRAAFGGTERDLSGIALQVELQSLLQKVYRKRLIRSAAYRKRNDMILRILEQKTRQDFKGLTTRVVWGSILPQDLTRIAQAQQLLVSSGLYSRKRSMTELGILDPEAELQQLLEERKKIRAAGDGESRVNDRVTRAQLASWLLGEVDETLRGDLE
jgi:hypothetical protein